ncbi:GNAT family N-acetyltransferase [Demequina sediminis]|uniref:GNAT family N-acetyltransferase n=1 Tax=Demequina sediminis TaxID=1930058 RepID=UPI0025744465|nr:GNAT family N-acetyltransferase [Demequina sediminis]
MIEIRTGLLPDDTETCARLWVRAIEARDGTVDAAPMARRVRSALAGPLIRLAVATAPRAGFALTVPSGSVRDEAFLHFLAVDPGGTGGGVGTALMTDAIDHASAAGFAAYGVARPHGIGDYAMQPYRLALASATPSSV